ncbi:neutral/alkaline non-lysosomal ceramidase N-terminal domain-containing protein [Microvirga lotononidis]|uniref:Neutral/alkaline non-lysosomal ceramidase n=1 Tax=Microvirga lotononidis TaxID=864069 RepID=I4Z2U2_9HYPH|nr:neutral/alkaline non-lysosomal ceramidase N-terminal domain-containing protein [Microvirga lotononidis]EIM30534.1 Neutral/alkaline non-lysosomal ceramidase [Microvirga lotononidis]WQO26366.1 neutral/alkaline non-lysosomal ceramidase N-terminal domain-containing protein [Microvirga lotononidis]
MIRAGTALVDITPPAGLALAGFAARSQPALGAHDPLTARAIVVEDTALLVADVIGLHGDMSRRIREQCVLPADRVVVTALHTHGGPVSMTGRLNRQTDTAYLERLEASCVHAINQAAASTRPARLTAGWGKDPGVARNRRHTEGIVDSSLPVLRIHDAAGGLIAVITAYACHPVVLGADNRLWTADYPHYVRKRLEAANPGAMALFLTGCAGDANTGHSAHDSISLTSSTYRSFESAQAYGERIADAACQAVEAPLEEHASVANRILNLGLERREMEAPEALAQRWHRERETADPARAALLSHWITWATEIAGHPLEPVEARVSVLNWGGVPIVALPGEIFAETALQIRQSISHKPSFIIGFAEDNPGYIPPASEYAFGGYEVDEAHRYYGQAATFASGSAEALAEAAIALLPRRTA